jgi:hypothetical protein
VQVGAALALRVSVVAPRGALDVREHLVDATVLLDVRDHRGAVADDPDAPEHGGRRVADGNQGFAEALWMVMTSLSVWPSSHPFWSARLMRITRMPWGVKLLAACGAKETLRRSVT